MSTLTSSVSRCAEKYGWRITIALSIGLLVLAANIKSPSIFLVLPAWLILGTFASVRFNEVSHRSPYKQSLYFMGVPLLFLLPLWKTAFVLLINVLLQPSVANLIRFGTCRPFLALAALYFAAACVFHGSKHQEHDEVIARYKESIALLIAELNRPRADVLNTPIS